jgi:hypothetical protein
MAPLGERDLLVGSDREDRRVVDEDARAPEIGDRPAELRDVLRAADVAAHRVSAAAVAFDVLDCLRRVGDIGDDDDRPLGGEAPRIGSPDAERTAGDDRQAADVPAPGDRLR